MTQLYWKLYQDVRRVCVEAVRTGIPLACGYDAIEHLVDGQTMLAVTDGLIALSGYISGAVIDTVERACSEEEGRFYAGSGLERKIDAVMSRPYRNVRREFLEWVNQ